MLHSMEMQEEEGKTLVWWNINSCPIPHGYDPRCVGRRIQSVLKDSGYSGPVSITAIGKLANTPCDEVLLRELSSTGIALIHAEDFLTDLFRWTRLNPPPVNIMLISGLCRLQIGGYKILLAYPQRHPAPELWEKVLFGVSNEWLWTSLLTYESSEEITRLPSRNESNESPWSCALCAFAAQSFDAFTTHLKSKEHAHVDLDLPVNPKMVYPSKIVKCNSSKIEEEKVPESSSSGRL